MTTINNNYNNQYIDGNSNIGTNNLDKVNVNYHVLSSKLSDIKSATNIIKETVTDAYSSTTKVPFLEPQILSTMLENYKKTFQEIINAAIEVNNVMTAYSKLEMDLSKLADNLDMNVDLSQLVNKLDMEVKSQSITLNDDIIASGDNEIEIDTVLKELEEKYGIGTLNNNHPIENENSFNDSENNSHNENPPSDENTSSN